MDETKFTQLIEELERPDAPSIQEQGEKMISLMEELQALDYIPKADFNRFCSLSNEIHIRTQHRHALALDQTIEVKEQIISIYQQYNEAMDSLTERNNKLAKMIYQTGLVYHQGGRA